MTLMSRPKTIFMGTSEFAVPVLQALHQNEYDICLVVSQPDRPRGRHLKTVATPIKNLAEKLGLQLFQPEKLCRSVCMEKIVNLHPDIIITAAYGQILTKKFLAIPRYGVLNVHASLLPLYRGPAPIQAAIIAGEKTTGVTIMLTEFSVDSGPDFNQTGRSHPSPGYRRNASRPAGKNWCRAVAQDHTRLYFRRDISTGTRSFQSHVHPAVYQ